MEVATAHSLAKGHSPHAVNGPTKEVCFFRGWSVPHLLNWPSHMTQEQSESQLIAYPEQEHREPCITTVLGGDVFG